VLDASLWGCVTRVTNSFDLSSDVSYQTSQNLDLLLVAKDPKIPAQLANCLILDSKNWAYLIPFSVRGLGLRVINDRHSAAAALYRYGNETTSVAVGPFYGHELDAVAVTTTLLLTGTVYSRSCGSGLGLGWFIGFLFSMYLFFQ
jgi:hypothetical protein